MADITQPVAVRQHARTKSAAANTAAPVTAEPVEWSTGDPIMRDGFDAALVKLIAAGTNRHDAVAVLRDLSEASERAELKLADELAADNGDGHDMQPLLSVARFSVGPNTTAADLDEGAEIIDSLAHDLAQAGSGGYSEQRIAEVCIGACARLLFTSRQYRDFAKALRAGGAA